MKNTIQFIAIAILVSISIFAVNAQEQTIVTATDDSSTTEKVEKKVAPKKQSTNDDSWKGFYVGGYAGNAQSKATLTTGAVFNDFFTQSAVDKINRAGDQRVKSNGFNGGGTFGYNYQKGNFLVGGEFDFGSQKINKRTISNSDLNTSFSNLPLTITQSVNTSWLLTARPRAGVVIRKILIYGTGGLAVTNIKYTGNFDLTTASSSEVHIVQTTQLSKIKNGWTVGAGLESKVGRHWSVKGEYLFNQFGNTSIKTNNAALVTTNPPTSSPYPFQPFTHSTDLKSHSVRFGVNYRF